MIADGNTVHMEGQKFDTDYTQQSRIEELCQSQPCIAYLVYFDWLTFVAEQDQHLESWRMKSSHAPPGDPVMQKS